MIILTQITKSYHRNPVLKDLDCIFPEPAITGIIGPNGAGKSTLIRIITGFEAPDRGELRIDGEKADSFARVKAKISYMPEKSSLYPDYSVTGFLRFYHRASGFRNDEVFQALGLEKVSRQKIKHLSKGWHQRLKLYVALASPRPTAVLDEPFEGFDPLQMQEIAKLLRKQNQAGKNFILSIHQLAYAEAICSHFIFLNQGCIIARGTLTELAAAYNTPNDLQEIFLQALKKW